MDVLFVPSFGLYLFAGLLGAVIGSFLNAAAWRIPNGVSIADGRSRCPQCGNTICWYDNVPIFSYLWLRGACRHCHKPIPARYLWVELVCAAGFVWHTFLYQDLAVWLWATTFFSLLLLLSIIDLETMLLPNILTLPGAVLFLGLSFLPQLPITPADAFIASFGSAGMLLGISLLYKLFRGIDGLGLGDIKLMLLLGAVLGVRGTLLGLVTGSAAGALVGITVMAVRGGDLRMRLPFGPFLALGALISLWFGDQLLPLLFPHIGL